ncbi:kielin/chordin-like protein isoform X2 [Dreissena polymorpha]|uniref:kielin/chordin-like protein isoform X2 n=1 Tax=Dreissena polymorpha TaxID=45954 RepID=UPI00226555E7|nr:kielin/chordin-like protein isoform X2 [Dreissena polymorpha]
MDTVHYFAFIFCVICVVSAVENVNSVLPLDCAFVQCAAPQCADSFTPPGKCCPVCKDNMKQGQCPDARPPKGISTICLVGCQGDDSCPGEQKCCRYGCQISCTNPVGKSCNYNGRVYKDGAQFEDECNTCQCINGAVACTKIACLGKKGFCPAPRGFGICVHECSSDYDCPDIQKCCSNGCGKVCMKPTQSGCPVNGVNYNEGATVPSKKANPCESCTCQNGSVQCEMMACPACVGYTPSGQCCPICGSWPHDIQ